MIRETAWVTQGLWGDENTPDMVETVAVSGGTVIKLVFKQGLYESRTSGD